MNVSDLLRGWGMIQRRLEALEIPNPDVTSEEEKRRYEEHLDRIRRRILDAEIEIRRGERP